MVRTFQLCRSRLDELSDIRLTAGFGPFDNAKLSRARRRDNVDDRAHDAVFALLNSIPSKHKQMLWLSTSCDSRSEDPSMMPSSGPVTAARPGTPSRVIQGYFPGGRPSMLQPSLPRGPRPAASVGARPGPPGFSIGSHDTSASATGALQPARPNLPAPVRPGALQPAMPPRPQMPQPILPQVARPATVQPQAGNAFALPFNFTLKPRGSGQPLPESIQKKMEAFFNTSFADVRVHVGHEAPSIGALAFTLGTDLYFAPGQYNPQSSHGQQLLGHELTHVVQQRAGRVPNPLGTSVAVVQDPALEAEAERMALRAASASVPIQAKMAAPGSVSSSLAGNVSRPTTVAANGAILPARFGSLGLGAAKAGTSFACEAAGRRKASS